MERKQGELMNRGVVYRGPRNVKVEKIAAPTFSLNSSLQKKKFEHGAIIKNIATGICGSDLHMYNGRTSFKEGMTFGHEMLGEVIQVGRDVEFIKPGDIVSVPFNVACGKCANCKKGFTNACLTTNPIQPGGIYGYAQGGDWSGGQTEYATVPYADFNLLKIPNRDLAMSKALDLALLSDVFPTGFHAAVQGNVGPGSTVYVAGAGPIGLACARSCFLLGASVVIVGDPNTERLKLAKSFGCHTVDLTKNINIGEEIDKILGEKTVDVGIDCVGYEASGHGSCCHENQPNDPLNTAFEAISYGGNISVPGVYFPQDPGAKDNNLQQGKVVLDWGKLWMKGGTIATGQTPVMKWNQNLMKLILWDRVDIAKCVNATTISLDEAPNAYEQFSKGELKKFIIDPHHLLTTPQ